MARASPEASALARIAFGRRLRAARIKAGWQTIEQAALAAGLDRTALTHLERGGRSPSAETIGKLVALARYEPRILFPRKVELVDASPLDESMSQSPGV